jgi:PleD family two-component response regulator
VLGQTQNRTITEEESKQEESSDANHHHNNHRNQIPYYGQHPQENQFSQEEGGGNSDESIEATEKHCKVLVVDDEPFNVLAIEGLLGQRGAFQVDKSFNG